MAVSYTHLDVYKRQVLGCLILLRQAFRYVKMRQVKKAVAQGEPYAFTNHLLSRSIRDFTVLLLCIGFLAGYMLFKYLRHEQLPGTIYYVTVSYTHLDVYKRQPSLRIPA